MLSVVLLCVLIAGCTKNTSPPTISGSAVDGNTLTANPGSWTGKGTISYAYQWQRCDSGGGNCQNVASATASTYELGHSDVGSKIAVVVTATDSDGANGASSATSAPTAVVAAAPPVNTAPPSISGTTRAGQTLSAAPGNWTGTPPISFAYQWQRCDSGGGSCQNVTGNGASYQLGTDDVGSTIRVSVKASNAGGSASALSPATAVIAASHDPVVVAVGDIACHPGDTINSCQQAQTEALAANQNPDDVLVLGDNQYDSGLLSEYQGAGAYGATWGTFNSIVRPIPGNHEYDASSSASGYFDYFGATAHPSAGYYSYKLGTWHIVALNSGCSDSGCGNSVAGATSSAQTSWLQSDLAANPTSCTLAYWHHPRFSYGFMGDSPGVGPLWTALYNVHADVVLNGHDHVYERYEQQDPSGNATTNGIREFVAGTGGESLFSIINPEPNLQASDDQDFGVLVLTLHATSYDWAFRRTDGTVVDSGTTACHGSGTVSAAVRAAPAARSARAARVREAWRGPSPSGPSLAFSARPLRSSLTSVLRHGVPVAIHCSRMCDVTVTAWLRQRGHLHRMGSFYETEDQIPKPYSRIRLHLPARRPRSMTAATLLLRFSALDAASHHRVVTRTLLLQRSRRGDSNP